MRRRAEPPGSFNVWPAFTDVLGGLVVVLIFLITIFVIGEVVISREIMGKDSAIGQLARIVEQLESLVGDERAENERLRQRIGGLESLLGERDQAIAGLEDELAGAYNQNERLAGVLAATEADLEKVEAAKAELEGDMLDAVRQLALINRQAALIRAEMQRLNRALLASEDERERLAGVIDAQALRIEEMDQLIKARLLDRVEELEGYVSEFFARLRAVFADNQDIQVEGDRFIFQSEVLFASGSADLSTAGQGDLDKFAQVFRDLLPQIPDQLPVIVQVQGHTDRVPIRTSRFANNWELSTQRAVEVVQYLIDQDVPPERLAAVGMGEHHPLDPADTPEAYRRNRRIEIKITSR